MDRSPPPRRRRGRRPKPRVSTADPPMSTADELMGLAMADLASLDLSSSSSPPTADLLPPLILLLVLPRSGQVHSDLETRSHRVLADALRRILSRDPTPQLLPALEVFAEYLVLKTELLPCFNLAAATTCPRLTELMCHHFISSVQDEEGFLSSLSWSAKAACGAPQIGSRAAVTLVRRSFSMPAAAQAHFVLLASRCRGVGDLQEHLQAFEISMHIYWRYLPALGVFCRSSGVERSVNRFSASVQIPPTDKKLRCQINSLVSFCRLHSNDDFPTNDSDLFDISVRFIEENRQVFDEEFREDSIIVMKSILSNILDCAKRKGIHELDARVSEEIICLAAVLRLMSSSFQQALHCIRQVKVVDDSQNEDSLALCKSYSSLSQTIHLLGQYEANELQRRELINMIGIPDDREGDSILMLSHFASLSVCCLRMRFGFMWNGCIFMMMMAVNLVVIGKRSVSLFRFPTEDTSKAVRITSTAMALQFKNIQKVRKQNDARCDVREGCSMGTLQRCTPRDGKDEIQAFLNGLPHYKYAENDDDVVQYIGYVPGMDYSNLFTRYKKYTKYKYEKWLASKRLRKKQSAKRSGPMTARRFIEYKRKILTASGTQLL